MIRVNNTTMKLGYFPDKTLAMTDVKFDFQESGYSDITIFWKFESLDEQIWLYNFVNYLNDSQFKNTSRKLILSYLPNARMDRTKYSYEVNTLKYFAKFINDLSFDAVICYDIHSNVGCSLINNLCHMSASKFIYKAIELYDPDVIMYPDEGAQKRYSSEIKYPYIIGIKKRDWETGKITGMEILNPQKVELRYKRILIVDDISSFGGTFYHAGMKLREYEIQDVALYVTHCENSIVSMEMQDDEPKGLLNKRFNPISHVYTTDSLITEKDNRITVIPIDTCL